MVVIRGGCAGKRRSGRSASRTETPCSPARRALPPTEQLHALVKAELDAQQDALAGYKRVVDVMLTDMPLPKTALRKVARGQIAESYSL